VVSDVDTRGCNVSVLRAQLNSKQIPLCYFLKKDLKNERWDIVQMFSYLSDTPLMVSRIKGSPLIVVNVILHVISFRATLNV